MYNHSTTSKRPAIWCVLAGALLFVLEIGWAAQPEKPAPQGETISPSRVLVKLWTQPGSFEQVKLVALAGDTLYVAGTLRGLEARRISDGIMQWKHVGKLPVDALPTERGNVVYLVEGGRFVTLDRSTGRKLSGSRSRIGAVTPIYPGENSWLIGSTDDRIYGIIPGTGLKSWRVNIGDHVLSSTWDGDNLAYFLTAAGTLYAVSISTRNVAWQYKLRMSSCSPPTLAGKTVYIGCADYYLYALDAASGALRWRVPLSAPVLGVPVAAGSRVYVATTDGRLHAVDVNSQTVSWTIPNARRVLTTTSRHVIFLRSEKGVNQVGIADSTTGKLISEATAMRYEFFLALPETGIFYAVAKNGDMIAIGEREAAKEKRAPKPWQPAEKEPPEQVVE